MSAPYLKAITSRRTIYSLKPELPSGVTIEEVQKIVQTIVKESPTAFNSQVNRAIILTGAAHKNAWNSVVNSFDNEAAKKRPESARDEAFGTIIFFTDDNTTKKLQNDFAAYAALFPQWADHASGAVQMSSWNALESIGLGGHLQHYNPYIKAGLPSGIPAEWSIHSQLVFGTPAAKAGEKTYIENEVKVYN